MNPKSKTKLAIILGIVFLLGIIATSLTLVIKDIIGWGSFALIIIGLVVLGVAVLVIYKVRKIKREPESLIKEIDPKEAEDILDDLLVEKYAEHLIPKGQRIMNIGSGDVEKTPIIHKWGLGIHEGKVIHLLMNLKQATNFSILMHSHETYIELDKSIEALAEHPKIEETEEDIISQDELGRPVRVHRKRRQTLKQKQSEEEQRERQEKEEV